uniref:Annexin 14 n=1 Tax=Spironucleus barkhanus TaxID=103874 RepID=A0A142C666_SPIBA|nr:annexin 14 [Spironucleus barkhanus]
MFKKPEVKDTILDAATLQQIIESIEKMKSGHLNDKKFIDLIKCYTGEQFNQINREFYIRQGQSISKFVSDLVKDEATEQLCLSILAPRYYVWAKSIHISFSDLINNSDLLITTILSMDAIDIFKVKQQYKLQFKQDLITDFDKYITGDTFWEHLLKAWLSRDIPGTVASRYSIEKDAKKLDLATKGSGTDIDVYIKIFTTSTHNEFTEIIAKYEKLVGISFVQSLDDEFDVQSLDYYAARLVTERLKSPQELAEFIFSYCFTEKNGDKPMISFLISMFKDIVLLSKIKGAQAKIKQQINVMQAGVYQNAVLSFFGFK